MDCIVMAVNIGESYYEDWRGVGNGVRAINPTEIDWDNSKSTRLNEIWACMKVDVPRVVEEMSKYFVGREIKVFNLTEIHVRVPGELKSKLINNDGILPV